VRESLGVCEYTRESAYAKCESEDTLKYREGVLQCVAACCSLQCVAVRCSVLRCIVVRTRGNTEREKERTSNRESDRKKESTD